MPRTLPDYGYLYLGDSARAPYDVRSAEVVNEFTFETVARLFDQGCTLVALAANTASTRALQNIQRLHLPKHRLDRRVLDGGAWRFATTDDPEWFAARGERLLGAAIRAERVRLPGPV